MTLRSHLTALALAALVPVAAFAIVVGYFIVEHQRETLLKGAEDRALALLTTVDAELKGSITTLEAIAVVPSLTDGNLEYFGRATRSVLAGQPNWVNINLALPDRRRVFDQLMPARDDLPPITDDGEISVLLQTGKPVLSGIALGPVSGQWNFAVRVPVVRDGAVKFVLSAVVRPDSIARLVAAQNLPEGWVGAVLDQNNRIVARTVDPEASRGRRAAQELVDALARSPSGWLRTATREGAPVYAAYHRSPASGWAFVLGVPAGVVDAAAWRSAGLIAVGLLASVALAFALARRVGRRIARPISALAAATGAIARGEHVAVPRASDIAELDQLAGTVHRSVDALRDREERLRLALGAGRMGSWEWDVRTNRVTWSPELEAIHGLPPGGFAGDFAAYEKDVHPEDRERLRQAIAGHLAEGAEHHVEYRIVRPDGSVRWVEGRGKVFRDATGAPLRLVGVCTDVTERKRAEERFRLALEASPSANVMVDRAGRIVLVNRQTERLFGYAREELIGQPVELLVPERYRRQHPEYRAAFAGAPRARPMGAGRELYGVRKDGTEVPIEIGLNPLDIEGEPFVLSAIVDITERKGAEQALKDADRHKDEFLAMLSHELRNPLAALGSAAHVLKVAQPASEAAVNSRGVIERQTRHMSRLIGDLLDIGRISAGKLGLERERLDLAEVVSGVVSTWRRSGRLERHRVSCAARPVWIDADRARIEQITANLLDNALKFTPAGKAIRLAVGEEAGAALLRVADEGAGLAAGAAQRIFDLFAQGDGAARGGMGVGLALVRRLVELHGGSVEASSEGVGRGATFTVKLPCVAQPQAAPSPERASPAAANQRVLIVEDNDDARQMLEAALALDGHEVRAARDGAGGLALAADALPDVALIDIALPDMDGYEVARRLRAGSGGRRIGLVAVTGYGQPEDQQRAFDAGFDAHLLKPVSAERLKQVIAALA